MCYEEGTLHSIRNLMKTMNLSVDKAMDALMIPPQDRERYAEAVKSM